MRVHLVNPSEVSFGTAVITPRWLYVLAAATPMSFGDPCLVDETLAAVSPAQIQEASTPPMLFAATKSELWHALGAPMWCSEAFMRPSTPKRPTNWAPPMPWSGEMEMWCGQRYCPIALGELLCLSTKAAGLKLPSSCRPAGIWCREKVICGLQSRPFAVAPNTALFAPFGELMVSVLDSVPPTLSSTRSSNCDDSVFASSRSQTTIFIP